MIFSDLAGANPALMSSSQIESKPRLEISIPPELGTVKDTWFADKPDQPFIFHLQTLHANYEGALKTSEIIRYLESKYKARLIFAEGASERLHPEFLQFFPDPKMNAQMLDQLAQKGELTGVDLSLAPTVIASEAKQSASEAIGIESADLYRSAFKDFKKVISSLPETDAAIGEKKRQLDVKASKVFSREFRELVNTWQKYEANHRDFNAIVRFFKEEAKKELDLDFENPFSQFEWPAVTRLVLLSELEKRVKALEYEKEKAKLKAWLAAKKIRTGFMERLDEKGTGSGFLPSATTAALPVPFSPRKAYEKFFKETYAQGFQFKDYPQITYRVATQVLQSELEADSLFTEINRLFESLFKKKAKTKEELALLRKYQRLQLFEKLLHLELTRDEWERVKQTTDRRPQTTDQKQKNTNDDQQQTAKQSQPSFPHDFRRESPSTRVTRRAAIHFYSRCEKRETVFYQKLSNEMKGHGQKIAILVTGGFHSQGMSRLFKENEMGYASIQPHIGGEVDSVLYHQIMLGKAHIEKVSSPQPLSAVIAQAGSEYARSELRVFEEVFQSVGKSLSPDTLASLKKDASYFADRYGTSSASPPAQISTFRSEARKEIGGREALLKTIVQNWAAIQSQGFFMFDMQKTLAARKQPMTSGMGELLGWLMGQGIRVAINSGNDKGDVFEQVVNPLKKYLSEQGKLSLLKNLTLFTSSGTVLITFDAQGNAVEHPEHEDNLKISRQLEASITQVLQEFAEKKFGLNGQEMEKLKKAYAVDAARSPGMTYEFPWAASPAQDYKPGIVHFDEMGAKPMMVQGPYIQLRGRVTDDFTTSMTITKLPAEIRSAIIARLKEIIKGRLGEDFLNGLSISRGGESSIDIYSVNANKAIALVNYVEMQRGLGRGIDLNHVYYFGDELTEKVAGALMAGKTHQGNDMIVAEFPNYPDASYRNIKLVAVSPEKPEGISIGDIPRTYYGGVEEKGLEALFQDLHSRIEKTTDRSEARSSEADKQRIDKLGKTLEEVLGNQANGLRKIKVSPEIDAYPAGNETYLVWSKGPEKGKIYWIQSKPSDEIFSRFAAAAVKKKLAEYVENMNGLVEKNKIQEAKEMNDKFSLYLHEAYFALAGTQFYDVTSYDFIREIQAYSSIEEWVKKSFAPQFPGLFRERKKPGSILARGDAGKLPFSLGVLERDAMDRLYFVRQDTFKDPADPVRLTHETVFSNLPEIIQQGGLASSSIYGKKTASWELDPERIALSWSWSRPKKKHPFDFWMVFAVGQSQFSSLKLFPATSPVKSERITEKLVSLKQITHVFVPAFAVDLTQEILHSHGHTHLKVLPFGYIPPAKSFSIFGRSEARTNPKEQEALRGIRDADWLRGRAGEMIQWGMARQKSGQYVSDIYLVEQFLKTIPPASSFRRSLMDVFGSQTALLSATENNPESRLLAYAGAWLRQEAASKSVPGQEEKPGQWMHPHRRQALQIMGGIMSIMGMNLSGLGEFAKAVGGEVLKQNWVDLNELKIVDYTVRRLHASLNSETLEAFASSQFDREFSLKIKLGIESKQSPIDQSLGSRVLQLAKKDPDTYRRFFDRSVGNAPESMPWIPRGPASLNETVELAREQYLPFLRALHNLNMEDLEALEKIPNSGDPGQEYQNILKLLEKRREASRQRLEEIRKKFPYMQWVEDRLWHPERAGSVTRSQHERYDQLKGGLEKENKLQSQLGESIQGLQTFMENFGFASTLLSSETGVRSEMRGLTVTAEQAKDKQGGEILNLVIQGLRSRQSVLISAPMNEPDKLVSEINGLANSLGYNRLKVSELASKSPSGNIRFVFPYSADFSRIDNITLSMGQEDELAKRLKHALNSAETALAVIDSSEFIGKYLNPDNPWPLIQPNREMSRTLSTAAEGMYRLANAVKSNSNLNYNQIYLMNFMDIAGGHLKAISGALWEGKLNIHDKPKNGGHQEIMRQTLELIHDEFEPAMADRDVLDLLKDFDLKRRSEARADLKGEKSGPVSFKRVRTAVSDMFRKYRESSSSRFERQIRLTPRMAAFAGLINLPSIVLLLIFKEFKVYEIAALGIFVGLSLFVTAIAVTLSFFHFWNRTFIAPDGTLRREYMQPADQEAILRWIKEFRQLLQSEEALRREWNPFAFGLAKKYPEMILKNLQALELQNIDLRIYMIDTAFRAFSGNPDIQQGDTFSVDSSQTQERLSNLFNLWESSLAPRSEVRAQKNGIEEIGRYLTVLKGRDVTEEMIRKEDSQLLEFREGWLQANPQVRKILETTGENTFYANDQTPRAWEPGVDIFEVPV